MGNKLKGMKCMLDTGVGSNVMSLKNYQCVSLPQFDENSSPLIGMVMKEPSKRITMASPSNILEKGSF